MISKAATRLLNQLVKAEDDTVYGAEVVCEGRSCYIGLNHVRKATVNELLRLCLLSDDTDQNSSVERYSINEEGRAILRNPEYVPKIVPHLL